MQLSSGGARPGHRWSAALRWPLSIANLARGFELVGDRWTLLILRFALYGVRRFDDFQADLEIARSVLSNRVAGLVPDAEPALAVH